MEILRDTFLQNPHILGVRDGFISIARDFADRFRKSPTDQELVQLILDNGFRNIVSVACSITDTIDAQWQELHRQGKMRLIRAADEQVLPGIAMGIYIGSGGKENALMHMQNSGFNYVIDGLVSFVESYELPAAVLVTWRGHDKTDISIPHQNIGKKTAPLTVAAINKESVSGRRDGRGFRKDLQASLDRVKSGRSAIIRLSPNAFRKTYKIPEVGPRKLDSVEFMRRQDEIQETKGRSIHEVHKKEAISREEAHAQVIEELSGEEAKTGRPFVIVTGNGFDARALYDQHHRELNIYNVGYMGSASYLAYGMAIANPELNFVSLEGDQNTEHGNAITFNLAAGYPDNMFRYVVDNGRGSSVGIADSLPLAPDNYRYSRVIRTVPEQAGTFKARRLEEGLVEEYRIDDDAMEIIARVGPLSFHIRRVMDTINQHTERRLAERLPKPESSNVPRAFLS